jgi:hypothetical protein
MDHVRRRHGRALASARASVRGDGGASDVTLLDNKGFAEPRTKKRQSDLLVAVPGEQNNILNDASGTSVAKTNPRKRLRQEDQGLNVETERTLGEKSSFQEIEKLRKELEEAHKREEVLIGIIDRLTKGSK